MAGVNYYTSIMQCEVCKSNKAMIFMKKNDEGESFEQRLCAACASAKGIKADPDGTISLILDKLFENSFSASANTSICPNCGLSASDFRYRGKLGCSKCITNFSVFFDKENEVFDKSYFNLTLSSKNHHVKSESANKPEPKTKTPELPQNYHDDIVLKTKVTMGRNLSKYVFPWKQNMEEKKTTSRIISDFLGSIPFLTRLEAKEQRSNDMELQRLVDYGLVEEVWAFSDNPVLYKNNQENLICTVNTENHLDVITEQSGEKIFDSISVVFDMVKLLDQIESTAFSEKTGYLTPVLEKCGNICTICVFLHLPALYLSGMLNHILKSALKSGMEIIGHYLSNETSIGDIYGFSINKSLLNTGVADINYFRKTIIGIAEAEINMRQKLFETKIELLKDTILRCYGAARFSRYMELEEAMDIVSKLRLGNYLGLISNFDINLSGKLLQSMKFANLIHFSRQNQEVSENYLRSKVLRAIAAGILIQEDSINV